MSDYIVPGGPPLSRTEKGLAYEKWVGKLRDKLRGMNAKSKKVAKAANRDFIRGLADPKYRQGYLSDLEKAVGPSAVHVDMALATLSVMYANDAYIGDRLMPAVPVSKRSDIYYTYPKRERLAYPDDEMAENLGKAVELTQTRGQDNYSVKDYGFKEALDLMTITNQDEPLDEMVDLVENINEGLLFRREKRILAIVTTSGNYAGNTAAAGTFWDATSGGSIVADFLAATAAQWSGRGITRNIGFCGIDVWNSAVANNPEIKNLYNQVREGLVSTATIGNYFGMDDILISRTREDTANIAQTASYARLIPVATDLFGILRVAQRPTRRSAHFGSTFRMKDSPYTTQWTDQSVGVKGGIYGRVAVSEDHKVVAGDTGFLITNVLT